MNYRIIADSSCELPEELNKNKRFEKIPFGMEIDGEHLVDDETMVISTLLKKIAQSPKCPKSSCPSPQTFVDSFEKDDAQHIYVFTISSKLSGCYNSAVLAKSMYEEEGSQKTEIEKKIFVLDSQSASCGESQLAMLTMELEEQGKSFEEITEALTAYRDAMRTYFVLDNIETLRKNGRMSGVKALVASTLSIKPVLRGDKGTIVQAGQAVGIKKALNRMVDHIAKELKDTTKRRIMITHCNNPERAEYVKKLLIEKTGFEEYVIMAMAGLSSLYANDGGIIVTY